MNELYVHIYPSLLNSPPIHPYLTYLSHHRAPSWAPYAIQRFPTSSEISPGCSLEGLMLKLKLQYFGQLMWRVDSLEKTLMLGGIWGRRRRGRQRMRWLNGITDSMDIEFEWTPGVGDGQGGLACCDSWGRKESDTTEQLNWTESGKQCYFLGLQNHCRPWLQWWN